MLASDADGEGRSKRKLKAAARREGVVLGVCSHLEEVRSEVNVACSSWLRSCGWLHHDRLRIAAQEKGAVAAQMCLHLTALT